MFVPRAGGRSDPEGSDGNLFNLTMQIPRVNPAALEIDSIASQDNSDVQRDVPGPCRADFREGTLESARANETTTSKGRRRLAGKTDHPDVYPSL